MSLDMDVLFVLKTDLGRDEAANVTATQIKRENLRIPARKSVVFHFSKSPQSLSNSVMHFYRIYFLSFFVHSLWW